MVKGSSDVTSSLSLAEIHSKRAALGNLRERRKIHTPVVFSKYQNIWRACEDTLTAGPSPQSFWFTSNKFPGDASSCWARPHFSAMVLDQLIYRVEGNSKLWNQPGLGATYSSAN